MVSRCAALWLLLATSACNLTPPCNKAARIICDVGKTEQDACSYLLSRGTDDRKSQDVCKEILPAAKALGEDPRSQSARDDWKEAREKLAALGFRTDTEKGDIANKIVNSGGIGSKLVRDLRDNSKEAEKTTQDAADRALKGEGP